MLDLLQNLFSSSQFIPHGHCYLWKPELVWLNVLSDSIIALAYYSIPAMIIYFVRQRQNMPFSWVFWLFSAFITACGTSHLMEIWTLWYPVYWLAGFVKAITALVSFYTALEIFPLIPQALALPNPEQLAAINQSLAQEIKERQQAEVALHQLNVELEQRISDRTAKLEALNREKETATLEAQNYAAKLILAMDAAQMGTWEWDRKTNKLDATVHCKRIFNYADTEEITYETWIKRIYPEDLKIIEGIFQDLLKGSEKKNPYQIQYRVIWSDGSCHWVDCLGQLYRDAKGFPVRMAGVVADITERRLAEERLRDSERRYTTLANLSPVGIFRCDQDSNYLYVNARWCQITGLSEDEALGLGWRNAIYLEDLERVIAEVENSQWHKELFECEFRFQHTNGNIIWVFSQTCLETDDDGQPIGYVGTIVDITERKWAEEALQQSEEQYRATFDMAAIGVAHLNLDGYWLRVNSKLCDIVQYTPEELSKMTFQDLTHPDDLEMDLQYVQQLVLGKIPNYSLEKRYIRKDGSHIWVNISVSLAKQTAHKNGRKLKYFITVAEDISDRKEAEFQLQKQAKELKQLNSILAQTTAELAKRNQELDQFACIVSHDLKAPLRGITNLSEWLEDDLKGQLSSENLHQMQLLRQRVSRMQDLINGLLVYSRVGRIEVEKETVNVSKLIAEVIDSLAYPPTFSINILTEMPVIIAKPLSLSQVFSNLISNAIKHHHRSEGKIDISSQEYEEYYEFTITDDGPGIAPENHDQIFGIFQTLQASNSQENTGIGLSIVKKIIENEGGEIILNSQLGMGATFRFTWLK